nr:MAG TPA: hypothetical protein [Caudoviricetes sp.]
MALKNYNINELIGTDSQTLYLEGYKLSISNGNSVTLPNSKIGQIHGEVSTYTGHKMYINQIWNFTHLTVDSYAIRNLYEIPDGFIPNIDIRVPLILINTGEYVGHFTIDTKGNINHYIIDKYKEDDIIFEKLYTCEVSYYTNKPYVSLNN